MELINKINIKKKIDKNKLINILFCISYCIIWAILFKKCKYGYGNLDETYYLQVTHRIAQGDALIAEEWHIGQLFSYLLLPFMYLYIFIFKTSTGIVLCFRYLYTFVWGIAALFIYVRLKRINYLGALFCSIFFLIYAPFGIMALSYNTFGIMFLVLSCVLNLTSNTKISNIVSGSFYSFAVLCCPSLVILLVYYLIYFLFIKKDKKQFLFFIIGIIIQFIIFAIFVLSRTSISKIIESIPYIMSHPEHGDLNFFSKTRIWILSFYSKGNKVILFALCIVIFVSFFINNKNNSIFVTLILIGLLIIYVYREYYYINHIVYPFAIGAPLLFQLKNDKIKNVLYSIWVPGIMYSFCLNYTSNQAEYAIFSALIIASIGCICGFSVYIDDMNCSNKINYYVLKMMLYSLIILQLFFEFNVRWYPIFWDTYVSKQNIMLDNGPEKGIFVSEEKKHRYDLIMKTSDLFDFSKNQILVLSNDSLYYLINFNIKCSSYSSWILPEDDLQLEYFVINENKIPDIIFYPSTENGAYDKLVSRLIDEYGFTVYRQNEYGIEYIKNYLH